MTDASRRGGDTTNIGLPDLAPLSAESQEPAELPEEARQTIAALPSGSALLISRRGPVEGSRFLLDVDLTTAGRSEKADILLDDATVSRRHAEFIRRDRRFFVRDVGSLNGTYLNRERVDEAPLSRGDEIQIGKFRLTFYPSPQDALSA